MCDITSDFVNVPFVTQVVVPSDFKPVPINTDHTFFLSKVVISLFSNNSYVNGLSFTTDINGIGPAVLSPSFPIQFSGQFVLNSPSNNMNIAVIIVTVQLSITVDNSEGQYVVTSYAGINGEGYLSFFGPFVATLLSYPCLNVCDFIKKAYNDLTTAITNAFTNNYANHAVDASSLCFALNVPAKLAAMADKMNKVCLGDSSSSSDSCQLNLSSSVTTVAGYIKSLANLASSLSPFNGSSMSLPNVTAILNAKVILGQLKDFLECHTVCESSSSSDELPCLNRCNRQGRTPNNVSKLEKAIFDLSNAVKENQKQVNRMATYIYRAKARHK